MGLFDDLFGAINDVKADVMDPVNDVKDEVVAVGNELAELSNYAQGVLTDTTNRANDISSELPQ